MKIIQKIATVTLITLNLVSCAKKEAPFVDPLITNRDTTISPSEDFFHYALEVFFGHSSHIDCWFIFKSHA